MIERRKVRSPIDGSVLRVYREEGEYVSAAAPTVATIAQIDKLRATFSIATSEARGLMAGQRIVVEFPDTQQQTPATIESISPVTDPESGTVRTRVVIDNSTNQFRCGVKCTYTPVAISQQTASH